MAGMAVRTYEITGGTPKTGDLGTPADIKTNAAPIIVIEQGAKAGAALGQILRSAGHEVILVEHAALGGGDLPLESGGRGRHVHFLSNRFGQRPLEMRSGKPRY